MRICALDLSLTATGFATNYQLTNGPASGVITPGKLTGHPRLRYVRGTVLELAKRADLVVIEGLAYGAKGNAMLDLAGLAAVIRLALTDAGHTYVDVPPSNLKQFAAGNGNANKDAMLAAAIRRLGYAGHDHNEADALWLLEMARWHYEARTLTQIQGKAMAKVRWPETGDTQPARRTTLHETETACTTA